MTALDLELAAFDEFIRLQEIADHAQFDPEKFLEEIHNEEKD